MDRSSDLLEDADQARAIRRPGRQALRQRLAVDELHDQVGALSVEPRVEDPDDARVIEPGEGLGFPGEALADEGMAEEGLAQDLDRDRAAELPVAGAVDDRHGALAQHAEQLVAVETGDGLRGFQGGPEFAEPGGRDPASGQEPLSQLAALAEDFLQLGRRDQLRRHRALAEAAAPEAGDGGPDAVEVVRHYPENSSFISSASSRGDETPRARRPRTIRSSRSRAASR